MVTWKPIDSESWYEISSEGQIRSTKNMHWGTVVLQLSENDITWDTQLFLKLLIRNRGIGGNSKCSF